MQQAALLRIAALFLLTYAILLVLSVQFGQHYVELLLPLYRHEIGWLTPDYRILGLSVMESHGEAVVALNLKLIRYLSVEGHAIPPGGDISSSTLVGHALQHFIVMLSLLLVWPAKQPLHRLGYLACGMPLLFLVEMLDIPLVLLGSVEDLILANVAPSAGSLLVNWMNFMNGGGRLALSIVAALAAIAAASSVFRARGNSA